MNIFGVWHSIRDPDAYKAIKYILNSVSPGQRVAIESPDTVEELLAKQKLTDHDLFFKALIILLKEKGANVVLVDDLELHRQDLERIYANENIGFDSPVGYKRSLRLVELANANKADFLVVGMQHAFDIRKLLGKRANVRFLTKRLGLQELKSNKRKLFLDKRRTSKEDIRKVLPALRRLK